MSAVIDLAQLRSFALRTLITNGSRLGTDVKDARSFLWYLATPYTVTTPGTKFQDEQLLMCRARLATRVTGRLLSAGLNVFSPISAHHTASSFILPEDMPDHAGWMTICYEMLDRCDGVIVSTMDGYYGSKGVRLEIERWIAREGKQRLLYASPIRENEPWEPRFSWQATKVENL